MNNRNRLYRAVTAAVLAMAFAGSGFATIGTAMGVAVTGAVWGAAALSAAICAAAAASGTGVVLGLPGLAVVCGGYALTHMRDLGAIRTCIAAWQGVEVDSAEALMGAQALLVCGALLFGALFFLMLYHHGFTGMAIMLLAAMLIFSHGMSRSASIGAAIPGLVAAAAAFALSDGMPREGMAVRVLLPSALAVLLALWVLPQGRVTWEPMENLATRVRSVFEQYFNYTHERIAFSISEEGYNFGGEINGQPVAMLGGPANPDPGPVMRVKSDAPLLLRGSIRATYTGYSWVDVVPKNRYLYYDMTHRSVRDRVFDMAAKSPENAFRAAHGEVELLDSSTSTLFVPGRLAQFDMDLSVAVYYNSSGEMFMAREAQPGDVYQVETLNPIYGDGLEQAVLWAEGEADGQFAGIYRAHSQLPEGIDPALYALTRQVTENADSPYARAEAIASYLRRNMRYRLDVDYPPRGRDFASFFVLESRQGYCSYFATAMAVMGRMAGLPTRYVEGYYARPGADGTATLTGMDAHAWAEVYFNGIGWIPYDATNGGPASNNGGGEDIFGLGEASDQSQEAPFDGAADGESEGDTAETEGDNAPEDESTPEPDDASATPPPPEGSDEDEPDDSWEDEPEDMSQDQPSRGGGFWRVLLVLLLLALLILAAWWVWRRLQATDIERLCRQSRRAQTSAMMIYRAILTLLAHMGQFQQGGETPEAFVERVSGELNNPEYAEFVQAVTLNRYGNRPIRKDDAELGLRAYRQFAHRMGKMERLRFTLTRLFRGLGDFENIP